MNKILKGMMYGGAAVLCVASGAAIQATMFDLPQRERNITAEPARKAVNPNALPGVEAPTNRDSPEMEAKVVGACNAWADISVRTYDSALKGVDRRTALYNLRVTGGVENVDFYKNVVKEMYFVIYDSKYQYTREQLYHYMYQVCDLESHRILKEKLAEAAK